jgi:hypothetical protein
VDARNPAAPVLVQNVAMPDQVVTLALAGKHAFTACLWSGLQVITICQPVVPVLVGSSTTLGGALDVVIDGNLAYAAVGAAGLQIFDISDPDNPGSVGSLNTPGFAEGVAVAGNHAYLAAGDDGLQIINVTNPAAPIQTGAAYMYDYAWAVVVDGDWAYVSADGLEIYDISDPYDPVWTGSSICRGGVRAVAVDGNSAYLADWYSAIGGRDITNPAVPTGSLNIGTYESGYGIAVSGDHVFVACGAGFYGTNSGIDVFDVTNPILPVGLGEFSTSSDAFDIVTTGDYAFVAENGTGLRVVDISAPGSLVSVGVCNTPGNARGIDVAGDFACVADSNGGLQIIRVFDRWLDEDRNRSQSTAITSSADGLAFIQFTATQIGDISWYYKISAGTWIPIVADGTWYEVSGVGPGDNEIYWRADLAPSASGEKSTVTELQINWLDEASGAPDGELPRRFALQQNVPNPFNPSTEIHFELPTAGVVELSIFDVSGQLVRALVAGETVEKGRQVRVWDGFDDRGAAVPSGTYFCRLMAGPRCETMKMTLVR